MSWTKHSNKEISKYESEGILVSKNFLDETEKDTITKAFFSVLSKYINLPKRVISSLDVEHPHIHEALVEFRTNNPKEFGSFYDELNLNSSLRSIFFNDKFMSFYSRLLGVKKENLYINGFMIRLDGPLDKKNTLDWHQDGPYYEQTYPEFNACVCWLPITKNNEENGTLRFISRTHMEYKKSTKQKFGPEYSTQFKNSPTKSEEDRIQNFEGDFGDMGSLHMNLKHASGKNISSKFRITLGCRFHDTSSIFNLGQELYFYKDSKSTSLFSEE